MRTCTCEHVGVYVYVSDGQVRENTYLERLYVRLP